MPALRPGYVPRPGIVNQLRVARTARVVLLSAPPGYGKTSLVAEWAQRDGRPFAWYRVDAADSASFGSYLTTALFRAYPDGRTPLAAAASHDRPDLALARLGALLSSAPAGVVVVDDVDLLEHVHVLPLLERLVDELPTGSQLVLTGWSEVPLPLARLRTSGELLELGVEDLRFTDREAATLLRNVDAEATDAEVKRLNASVEGWPAGLHLAAMSQRYRSRTVPAGADNALMLEFFAEALLSHVSDDDLRFLTRTSVLDTMCGPLCDVVTGMCGSANRLERFERSNLFVVPLDHERRWYRFHSVFRQALAIELERREPALVHQLRTRAAIWCSTNGDPVLALDYAEAAGDLDQLGELVERFLPSAATGLPGKASRWLSAFDEEALLEQHPTVAAIGALTWAMSGRPDAAERWAAAAEQSARALPDAARTATVAPWNALLRALMHPSEVIQMGNEAEDAVGTIPFANGWSEVPLVTLGYAYALQGESSKAEAIFEDAADAAASGGSAAVESVALACHSLIATGLREWALADDLAAAAMTIVRNSHLDNDVLSLFALAASARADLRQGDWAEVQAELAHADTLLPRLTEAIGSFAISLRIEFARVRVALGDADGAGRLLDAVDGMLDRRPQLRIFQNDALAVRTQLEVGVLRPSGRLATLTAAELRLLPFLTTHLSFREIAERLYVSRNTVKTQAISMYRKLGVCSRGEAIERASQLGLVECDAVAS